MLLNNPKSNGSGNTKEQPHRIQYNMIQYIHRVNKIKTMDTAEKTQLQHCVIVSAFT